jgi:hypothetical protein
VRELLHILRSGKLFVQVLEHAYGECERHATVSFEKAPSSSRETTAMSTSGQFSCMTEEANHDIAVFRRVLFQTALGFGSWTSQRTACWSYRTGLIDIEPSLWQQNTDIESCRPETGAENAPDGAEDLVRPAEETRHRRAN